ncbi:MAG TPA: hypothetical protein VMR23_05440 [Candidatus Limnocylindria bacterium]|nr:hypothetical protein [Candidatus Limnocylindria bacterium]
MHAHSMTYATLQRRLISQRRSRDFFSPRITQQVRTSGTAVEVLRAAVALASAAAWCAVLLVLAA